MLAMTSGVQRFHSFASHYCDGIKTYELNMDKIKSLALLLVKITPTSDSRLGTCVCPPRKPYLNVLGDYGATGVVAYISGSTARECYCFNLDKIAAAAMRQTMDDNVLTNTRTKQQFVLDLALIGTHKCTTEPQEV